MKIENFLLVLLHFLYSIQVSAQADRHYVIQLAFYEDSDNYNENYFNQKTLKPYGQLVQEEIPEKKLRLLLLDKRGKFFTHESAQRVAESIRKKNLSKAFVINILDIPIKSVTSRVVKSDGTDLMVNFQLPSPKGVVVPDVIPPGFNISNPDIKYPASEKEFYGIQVYCGHDRSEKLCAELKKKFKFDDYNCKQVSPSPVESSDCKKYLYGIYKSYEDANNEMAELKRQGKYDRNEPFQIMQVGQDPLTKKISYRKNKYYTVQLAYVSQFRPSFREKIADSGLDVNQLYSRQSTDNDGFYIIYGKYQTYVEVEKMAKELRKKIDRSVINGDFKVTNFENYQ